MTVQNSHNTNHPTRTKNPRWFFQSNGRHAGPMETDRLVEMYYQGKINDRTMVVREGARDWAPLEGQKELRNLIPKFAHTPAGVEADFADKTPVEMLNNPDRPADKPLLEDPTEPTLEKSITLPELPEMSKELSDRMFSTTSEPQISPDLSAGEIEAFYATDYEIDEIEKYLDRLAPEEKKYEKAIEETFEEKDVVPVEAASETGREQSPEIEVQAEVISGPEDVSEFELDFELEPEIEFELEPEVKLPTVPKVSSSFEELVGPIDTPLVAEELNEIEQPAPKVTKKKFSFWKLGLGLSAVVVFCGVTFTAYQFVAPGNRQLNFPKLDSINGLKLKRTALKGGRNIFFGMAPSMSGGEFYLSVNRPWEGNFYIEAKSLPLKTLPLSTVHFKSKANFEESVGKLGKLKFEKGTKFVPGYYEVKVHGRWNGFVAKGLSFLKSTGVFNFIPDVRNFNYKVEYTGTHLLVNKDAKGFRTKLKTFRKKIFNEQIRPLNIQTEKYKTLQGLLGRVENYYESALDKKTKVNRTKFFNRQYANSIGPLIQDFVFRGKKVVLVKNKKLNGPTVTPNSIARNIAALAADMSGHLSRSKSPAAGDFEHDLATISSNIDEVLTDISKKVEDIQI